MENSFKTKIYPCGGTFIYIGVPSEEALFPLPPSVGVPCCIQCQLLQTHLYMNPYFSLSFDIFKLIFSFEPKISLNLFLSTKDVAWFEGYRNIFKSLLMSCFIIKQSKLRTGEYSKEYCNDGEKPHLYHI